MEENQNSQTENLNPTLPVSPIEQTPPPTPPVSNSTKSKFSLATIIAIIVLLLVFGSTAGFYVFKSQSLKSIKPTPSPVVQISPTPTTDPNNNWPYYTNEKLGFSIQRPGNWVYVDETSFSGSDYQDVGFRIEKNNFNQAVVEVWTKNVASEIQNNATILSTGRLGDYSYSEYQKIPVGSNTADFNFVKWDPIVRIGTPTPVIAGGPTEWYEARISANNKFYILTFPTQNDKSKEEDKKIFDRMLSSFKFTQ